MDFRKLFFTRPSRLKPEESVTPVRIPVIADYVERPGIYYGDTITEIHFRTEDEQFGRITFDNLDALRICRGEFMPYPYIRDSAETWIFKIGNSKWLKERFDYEHEYYGDSYEFGGDVTEMLTDFGHYFFSFHDQFIEVISRGFWFEKSSVSLFKQPLQAGHPFLDLPEECIERFETAGIKAKLILNPIPVDQLIKDSCYCRQQLMQVAVELDGKYSILCTLFIQQRESRTVSLLIRSWNQLIFKKKGIATFQEIKPFLDKEIYAITERRRQMGK